MIASLEVGKHSLTKSEKGHPHTNKGAAKGVSEPPRKRQKHGE